MAIARKGTETGLQSGVRQNRNMKRLAAALLLATALAFAQAYDIPPSVIQRIEPQYSAEAARARVQSKVTLSVVIDENGKATDIRVSKGAGFGLDEKAIEAMGDWIFRPATKAGKPVASPANIEMNFSMLVKDPEDHNGQTARLNFTLPEGASRPELIAGKLPGNPNSDGDISLKFAVDLDRAGVPRSVTKISSNDAAWEKIVQRVVLTWRFRPAMVNGTPVAASAEFELDRDGSVAPAVMVIQKDPDEESGPVVAKALPVDGLNPRSHHTTTVLRNGTVLIVGGGTSAQIFDWATRKIVATGSLNEARENHTATPLPDGTVLIAGGENSGQKLASAEIYDPSTGKFSLTGKMAAPRSGHTAVTLADGRVLICLGGEPSTEIYDPKLHIFARGPSTTATDGRAVALEDGNVLVTGSGAELIVLGGGR